MRGAASLALEGVAKSYGATAAVADVSVDVAAGAMLGLLGPSGCGKTTVLRMIAGLVPVSAGTIRVDGVDVTGLPPHRRDIGLVFQHYALFPHLTVAQNVAFGLEMRRVPAADARARVAEALEMVRLPDLGARRPRELSGGQQQRVALARALVIRPRILLLDEPLSNLDARLRDDLRGEIRDIQRRLAITTVFVTHDQAEALAMCDTVGVMTGGRLVQLGAPREVYERPVSREVAEFVGRVNAFPCRIVAPDRVRIGAQEFAAAVPDDAAGAATATLRPHRIALASPGAELAPPGCNVAAGVVTGAAFVGDVIHYRVDAGGMVLAVDAPAGRGREPMQEGEAVVLTWPAADMLVFPQRRDRDAARGHRRQGRA
ncbi:MAG: ABC transporter ATP-binding protein [Vicinamibacterales bacterium]